MADHGPDEELDQALRRAFAAQPSPADDVAFVARVRADVAGIERRQRLLRAAVLASLAAAVVLATPVVVEYSVLLAQGALSPMGAILAVLTSVGAAGFALRWMR